jgi:hypothetical protein
MEFWGLGVILALWRYFAGIDWDLRVRLGRKRRKANRL